MDTLVDYNGLKVMRNGEKLVFVFNRDEATGTVIVEPCEYGLWIYVDDVSENPIALVDLFYNSPAGKEEGSPKAQLVVYGEPYDPDKTLTVAYKDNVTAYEHNGVWKILAEEK